MPGDCGLLLTANNAKLLGERYLVDPRQQPALQCNTTILEVLPGPGSTRLGTPVFSLTFTTSEQQHRLNQYFLYAHAVMHAVCAHLVHDSCFSLKIMSD